MSRIACLSILAAGTLSSLAPADARPSFRIAITNDYINASRQQFLLMSELTYFAAKVALDEGLLADVVPNFRDFTVTMYGHDTSSDEAAREVATMLAREVEPTIAILGAGTSRRSMIVRAATSAYQVPMVNAISTATELSDRSLFPFFARASYSTTVASSVSARLCVHFGWKRVVLIYSMHSAHDRALGQGFLNHFQNIEPNGQVIQVLVPNAIADDFVRPNSANFVSSFSHANAVKFAEHVASHDPRVIIYMFEEGLPWLIYFHDVGLVGPGYAWIMSRRPDRLTVESTCTRMREIGPESPAWNYEPSSCPWRLYLGSLSWEPDARGQRFYGVMWDQLWKAMTIQKLRLAGAVIDQETPFDPDNEVPTYRSERNFFTSMLSPDVWFGVVVEFDTALMVIAAIGRLLAKNQSASAVRGEALYNELISDTIEGISGKIRLDGNGERIGGMRMIVTSMVLDEIDAYRDALRRDFSYTGSGLAVVDIGSYDCEFDVVSFSFEPSFADGTGKIPPDVPTCPDEERPVYVGREGGCVACNELRLHNVSAADHEVCPTPRPPEIEEGLFSDYNEWTVFSAGIASVVIVLCILCILWLIMVCCRRRKVSLLLKSALAAKSTAKLTSAIEKGERQCFVRKKLRAARAELDILRQRYAGADALLDVLAPNGNAQFGHTRLVRGSWLAFKCKRFARCQDLPDEAFWPPNELRSHLQRVEIVAVSYCWQHPVNPDPKGLVLKVLRNAITKRLSVRGPGHVVDLAIFLDFMSLPQNGEVGDEEDPRPGAERSDEEKAAYAKGKEAVDVWYAHQLTTKWVVKKPMSNDGQDGALQNDAAESETAPKKEYKDRGWPFFELAMASLLTERSKIIELDPVLLESAIGWNAVHEGCSGSRMPPQPPDVFSGSLRTKQLTDGKADVDFLSGKYRHAFEETLGNAKSLRFVDLDWGDEDFQELAKALSLCTSLERLVLCGNAMTEQGATDFVGAAARHCGRLRALDLSGNHVAAASQNSLLNVWEKEGGRPVGQRVLSVGGWLRPRGDGFDFQETDFGTEADENLGGSVHRKVTDVKTDASISRFKGSDSSPATREERVRTASSPRHKRSEASRSESSSQPYAPHTSLNSDLANTNSEAQFDESTFDSKGFEEKNGADLDTDSAKADRDSDAEGELVWEIEAARNNWVLWTPGVEFTATCGEEVEFTQVEAVEFRCKASFVSATAGFQTNLKTRKQQRLRRVRRSISF